MISEKPEIRNLSQLTGHTFNIVQPSIWKSHFEIKYNDQILGTIDKHGWFGLRVLIRFFEGAWEIYPKGFWSSEIAVKEMGKENPFAFYKRKIFSGEGFVHLPKGKQLKIKLGAFRSNSGIYNLMGNCIVSLKDKVSFKSVTATTEINVEESSETLEGNSWVIILAWHLTQMRRRSRRAG